MLNRPLAISVLNPTSLFPDDINQNSIVLKVTYGSISFLFMGDANANAETRIASSGTNLLADILKVGHLTAPWSSNVNTSHTIPASFLPDPRCNLHGEPDIRMPADDRSVHRFPGI